MVERLRSDTWATAHPREWVKGERSECVALKALAARARGVLDLLLAITSERHVRG